MLWLDMQAGTHQGVPGSSTWITAAETTGKTRVEGEVQEGRAGVKRLTSKAGVAQPMAVVQE